MNVGDIVVVKFDCPNYRGRCNNMTGRVERINPKWKNPVAVSFDNIDNADSKEGYFYFSEGDLIVVRSAAPGRPEIKNVYFNDPVTVVIWNDGTKTIVRCSENDSYDPEKGLAMAIVKRAYGNDNKFHKIFKKWIPKEDDTKCETVEEFFETLRNLFLR